jgi:hypothetical protein
MYPGVPHRTGTFGRLANHVISGMGSEQARTYGAYPMPEGSDPESR